MHNCTSAVTIAKRHTWSMRDYADAATALAKVSGLWQMDGPNIYAAGETVDSVVFVRVSDNLAMDSDPSNGGNIWAL